jgi:chemotaxis protein methyltransferase CheR
MVSVIITDAEGIQFLQWCLPRLRLRWPGFRKVQRQVYKRLHRRLQELGLSGVAEYRAYLEDHPAEWAALDALCWISISRFYRDRGVFQYLEREVLGQLAQRAVTAGESEVRCWSAGCAAGEEPYTLAILWKHCFAAQFPTLGMQIVATDVDPQAIHRAELGCYPASSLKELPVEWRAQAFVLSDKGFCLKPEYQGMVTFFVQDVRETVPDGPFHLILCRNLVFTYFDDTLQRETLHTITERLVPGGTLVIGALEVLPEGVWGLEPWAKKLGVYRKSPVS